MILKKIKERLLDWIKKQNTPYMLPRESQFKYKSIIQFKSKRMEKDMP